MGAFNFNRNKPKLLEFFDYPDFFSSLPGFFMSINWHSGYKTTFSHQTKLNSPNEKELQDVISRLKVFFNDETHTLTCMFMSHSVLVYLLYHTYICVFLFCTRVS